MILIRPATAVDAAWVGAHLRNEDAEEVRTATGDDPMASVLRAFASSECYAIYPLRNDHAGPQPCALFGVSPDPQHPLHGVIWFLGTDDMRGRGLSILREAPRWLDHLSRHYPAGLHNFADKRNWLHIRWCMLTGFTAGQSVPVNGVPFQYIHRPVGVPPRV